MTTATLPPVDLAPEPPRRRVNPHYMAYAAAHGFRDDPDGMLAHDRHASLGGTMTRFLMWIDQQQKAFRLERGLPAHDFTDPRWRPLGDGQLAEFTAWLTAAAAAKGNRRRRRCKSCADMARILAAAAAKGTDA